MKVGFIGLGLMGRGMAGNLQKAGHQLVVSDLSQEAAGPFLKQGAIWASSPAELGAAVDIVFTSLPTPADVEKVGFGPGGLCEGLKQGAAWFDLSTNSVDVVRRLHEQATTLGVSFLDAPVSGGPGGAASGKMAIWVGGDQAVYDRHQTVLSAMADRLRYIGPIGAGSIAKLVHNMAAAAINAITAEVMTLGVKAGLEPMPLYEAMRTGAVGRMRSFDQVGPRFLQGKLDPPSFALRLLQKDIDLTLQLAKETRVPMRLCELVGLEITEAMNRGWGGRDAQSFLLLQQERAAVPPFAASEQQVKDAFEQT